MSYNQGGARPCPLGVNGVQHTIDLSVIVPMFNERHRLRATLEEIRRHLAASSPARWELIVVDDGSTDGTAELVRAMARAEPRIHLIRSPVNHGKGHAVRLGVSASRGRQVLFTDADLATPIEELSRLRAGLARGYAAAIGSRARPASDIVVPSHPLRRLLSALGNRLIRALATPGIADTQCGFKLFDGDKARTTFALARINGFGFDVEILVLFARFGWPVTEVPVRWAHQAGSKVRPLDYLRVLAELVQVRRVWT